MPSFHNEDGFQEYEAYPLVRSMLLHEKTRTASLTNQGKNQINYPKSSDGWLPSLFIIEGRALDWMILPWLFVVGHATLYTVIQEICFGDLNRDTNSWEIFFSFALNSTLAFLLVFRLNRAASRFWLARRYWGDIVAQIRTLVSGVLVHGNHDRLYQEETIRWTAALSIAIMDHLRGEKDILFENYAGILSNEEINTLIKQSHPPVYAADKVRSCLKHLFFVDADVSLYLAISRTQEMDTLENQLNTVVWCGGGMERIKGTPLPMVYVSHLRTFLLINLILLPWVFGPTWGWITIPIIAVSAFAWLGIESAALEVERPFFTNRVNSLNMDGFIIGLLSTILQQIKNHAEDDIQHRGGNESTWALDAMASSPNATQSDTKEC